MLDAHWLELPTHLTPLMGENRWPEMLDLPFLPVLLLHSFVTGAPISSSPPQASCPKACVRRRSVSRDVYNCNVLKHV